MNIENKYGTFDSEQLNEYKTQLHKKIFRLLLFKDPKTEEYYKNVDLDKYFIFLIKQLNGLNELLLRPVKMIEIMSLLEAARIETQKDDFEYSIYRKFILDAHHLLDNMWEVFE